MRLIDADKLRMMIRNNAPKSVPLWVYETIDSAPTAYDVDAVVEQLRDCSFNADMYVNAGMYVGGDETLVNHDVIASEDAIEIVKGGGVDAN